MASQVRIVLLASSFSQGAPGVPSPLVDIYGTFAVNHTMAAVRCVTRLQPMNQKVFMVTNGDNHSDYLSWATQPNFCPHGAPAPSNIISNGANAASGAKESPLDDVALAVQTFGLSDCHVVVVSLDYMLDPLFNLQRVVEHAITRGKDTALFVAPPPGEDLAPHVCLDLDLASTSPTNPRIEGVDAGRSGLADGIHATVLAPIVLLRRETVQELLSAVQGGGEGAGWRALPPHKHMGGFLGQQVAAGRPVYSLETDIMMPLSSPEAVTFADGFVQYSLNAQASAGAGEGPAAMALATLTKSVLDQGLVSRGDPAMDALLGGASEAKRQFLRFYAAGGDIKKLVGDIDAGKRPVPMRFHELTMPGRNLAQKQHPVYLTTNNDYGLKQPMQTHIPDNYAGASTAFSTTFFGGPSKVSTMRTAVTRSKVHKLLDDF